MPSKHRIALVFSMVLLMVAAARPAAASSAPDDEEGQGITDIVSENEVVTKVFKIENGNVGEIAEVLEMFGGRVRPNKELGVIAWQGPANRLPAVEAAVESLDTPPKAQKNIELTVYILAALPGSGPASNDQVPESLAGVTTQIRKLFDFQSIRLLETAIIRTRDGRTGEMEGGLSLNPGGLAQGLSEGGQLALALANRQGSYDFKFHNVEVVSDEEGSTIRVNGLELMILLPTTYLNDDGDEQRTLKKTELATDIDVREGQKVVVGKTSIEGARETMFMVLTAEVLG